MHVLARRHWGAIGDNLRRLAPIIFAVLPYLGVVIAGVGVAYLLALDVRYAVAAVGGAIFLILAVTRPFEAFILWLLVSPMTQSAVLDTAGGLPQLTFDRAALPILLLSVILRKASGHRGKLRIEVVDAGMALVMAWAAGSILLTRLTDTTFIHSTTTAANLLTLKTAQVFIDHFVYAFMAFQIARNVVTTRRHVETIFVAMACIVFYLTPIGIVEHLTHKTLFTATGELYMDEGNRAAGPFVNAAIYGLVLCFSLISLIYTAHRSGRISARIVYGVGIAITLVAIVMTYTRSVWVSVVLAVLAIAALDTAKRKRMIVILASATVILVALLPAIKGTSIYRERISNESPITSRRYITKVSIGMFKIKPWLGHGLGTFDYYKQRYPVYLEGFGTTRHPPTSHNTFLTILVELGVVGFIPYVILMSIIVWQWLSAFRARRKRTAWDRQAIAAIGAATAAYAITACTIDTRFLRYPEYLLWIMFGLVFVIRSWPATEDSAADDPAIANSEQLSVEP